jgi:hypothetical protein
MVIWLVNDVDGADRGLIGGTIPIFASTERLGQDRRSPGRGVTPGPVEYEAGLPPTASHAWRSGSLVI